MSIYTDKNVQPVVHFDSQGNELGGLLVAGTDRSGTITTGGTAQTVAAANPARRKFTLQNVSAGNLGVTENDTAPVIGSAGTYTIAAGGSFSASTSRSIRVIGATTGQAFTATEA